MRTELTLQDADGVERDVAIEAPVGTMLDDVLDLLGFAPSMRLWSGQRQLRPNAVLGRGALSTGVVVSSFAGETTPAGLAAELAVVGGADAGKQRAIGKGSLVVGRDAGTDLVLADPRVSRRHAVVTTTDAGTRVRDLRSTHGTFVDGVTVSGETVLTRDAVVRLGDTFLAISVPSDPAATMSHSASGVVVHNCGRPATGPAARVITVPTPPAATNSTRIAWVAALVPAVAGGVLAWMLHSPLFLAFAALTPLALVAGALGDRAHWRRARRRAAARHARALAATQREIAASVRDEIAVRRRAHPDPAAMLRIARTPTVRLWERRRDDEQLLVVRIGLGDLPSALLVERRSVTGGSAGGESLVAAAALPAVPVTVDLRRTLGIAAPTAVREGLARWIIAQLAVYCSPADVEIVLVLADDRPWQWARWLPHVAGRVARSGPEHEELLDELIDLVRSRYERRHGTEASTTAHLVIVFDRVRMLGSPGQLDWLLAFGPGVGVTALLLDERQQLIPASCMRVVRLSADGAVIDDTAVVSGAVDGAVGNNTGNSTRQIPVAGSIVLDRVSVGWAERVARALAPLRDARVADRQLPTQCRLADVGIDSRADATEGGADPPDSHEIARRWRASDGTASTVLGIGPNGPLVIDLERDGPHMLIAGTTGSGKSELLQTLVVGLASYHPPSELTVLLIDYKGGAAFAECVGLPHTVGLVTDLDTRLTRRVLTSLDSEIRRRERLFARAGTVDLAAYHSSAAGGDTGLPRLVIVVDEFAALADELPAFVDGLVGVAQRGRSLGLHLVLATQRPAGVVSPVIRANTALRVALRMTSAAESIDVLDEPQAAEIDRRTPGRGHLLIGTSTVEFQAARVGGRTQLRRAPIRVEQLGTWRRPLGIVPDGDGTQHPTQQHPTQHPQTDLCRYVDAIASAANNPTARQPAPRRPWLPPLPARLLATELPTAPLTPRFVPYGLLDQPRHQRQDALVADLATGGTILVVGSGGSGRSTALCSIATAAAARLSPHQLHLHAIDAAGAGLRELVTLPHLGTLATMSGGIDLIVRLVRHLRESILHRAAIQPAEPTMLVLIDGWDSLVAAADDHDGGRTVEQLLAMLPEATAAGVTFAISGGRAALTPRLTAHAATRLVLGLQDAGEYALAGIDAGAAPDLGDVGTMTPGRGVRAADGAEFQLALGDAAAAAARWAGAGFPNTVTWTSALRTSALPTGALLTSAGSTAVRLRRLPRQVRMQDLPAAPGRWVLGVGGDGAGPLIVDLDAGCGRFLIAGPPRSGRSTVLCTLLRQLAYGAGGADGADGDRRHTGSPDLRSIVVAAPPYSPLAHAARDIGLIPSDSSHSLLDLETVTLMLIDDTDYFLDTPMGDALTARVRADPSCRVVASGRSDSVAVTFRGLAAELRRARCGVLLQPGPVDGELFGINVPRSRGEPLPGRGVLVPDPAWGLGPPPIAVQLAY